MKFKGSDTGTEHHYDQCQGLELEEIGEWHLDYNNIVPCEWTICKKEYREWYLSTHPKPVDIHEATRYWLKRRTQLHRRQHPAPGSYEEFRQNKAAGNGKNYEDRRYDYISAPQDTWDRGSIYRMYTIRQQAAIDMTQRPEEGIFINEKDVDDWLLIANDYADEDDFHHVVSAAAPIHQRKSPSSYSSRFASGRNLTPTEHCTHCSRLALLLPFLTGST